MLCYLLRWPDDRVSFLSIRTVGELREYLDVLGDTTHCTAQEVTDPVFITFAPAIKSHTDGYGRMRPDRVNTEREALDDLTQLLETGLMSDVTLEINGQQIAAHKAILAQRCSYFRAMFTVDMAEARKNAITIEGFSYMTMNLVVRFLYSGMVHYPTCSELQSQYPQRAGGKPEDELHIDLKLVLLSDLLAAADYFNLSSLTNLCSQMLYDLIDCFSSETVSNYLHVLELSKDHRLPRVQDHCIYRMDSFKLLKLQDEDESRLAQAAKLLDKAFADNELDPLLWGASKELYQLISSYYTGVRDELSIDMVKDLIAKGADVNRARILHHLCSLQSEAERYYEKVAAATEIIQELGHLGYDMNLKDSLGRTPLYRAAVSNCTALVQVLLKLGADASVVSNTGLIPQDVIQSIKTKDGEQLGAPCMQERLECHETTVEQSEEELKNDGGGDMSTSDQPSCSQREACSPAGHAPSKDLGGGRTIILKFLEQFVSGDSINDTANVSYELAQNGYLGWDFEQKLFNFCYPRLNSQLQRFTGHGGRARKTGNMSVQEVLQCALKADIEAARAGNGSGRSLQSLDLDT